MSFTYKGQTFETVWAARKVFEGFELAPVPCSWAVEYIPAPIENPETGEVEFYDDPWPLVRDCGAEVVFYERGWACAAGHSHVYAEVRDREGWDYAEDEGDVRTLAAAGKVAVPMGSRTFL